MKKYFYSILTAAFLVSSVGHTQAPPPAAAAPAAPGTAKILKIATLAPEGTTLHKGLLSMKNEVMAKTGGKVDFQIYAGGVAGDEKDVVRKMRIGQLQGGALTGVGLGMIEPEIRVLENPFLFQNYQQADKVYAAMRSYFEGKFREKGFELLGWAEVGFVKIFSNKPITKKADLAGLKMWMWEGDPLAQAMYESLKVVPVPLAITDVLTSLQTGLIDGCYAPELAAIAFQWHTKSKYMTDVNLTDGTGGVIVAKQEWAKLSASEQAVVKEVISAQAQKLIAQTRIDNAQSKAVLQAAGIQIVQLTPEALVELQGIAKEVSAKLVGKLYPQTLLDKVVGLVGGGASAAPAVASGASAAAAPAAPAPQ
ncbi:MAG: TRAP transporter substrate-binding protein DctP [Deltaproteobacteria bacterium]|nr:TRAP transporter substrate-binding protein DctP [Deltaproteobacteria bacterium]